MAKLPDIESLALLVSVAQHGSLGKAARQHGISQPSASARIAALEQRLGLQLVVRSTRGSTLTEAGRVVVERGEAVLAAVRDLSTAVAAVRQRHAVHLPVWASLTIAEYLLPAWLVRLHADNPEIAVKLQVANSTDVIAAVLAGRAPVGFVEGPAVPRSLSSVTVGVDQLVVVVAPDHPWAGLDGPLPVERLAATPLLLREPESGTRQALERAVGGAEKLAEPALELSTTTAILRAAAGGSAPAVLSELTVRGEVLAGRLVHVPVADFRAGRRLRAVWPRGVHLGPAAAALVELARAAVRSPAAG